MDILKDDLIGIHQEFIRQETRLHLALEQSGIGHPSMFSRALPAIGDALCKFGSWLKEFNHHKLTSEEASAPTFIIML